MVASSLTESSVTDFDPQHIEKHHSVHQEALYHSIISTITELVTVLIRLVEVSICPTDLFSE
jgi:hypothetical protein